MSNARPIATKGYPPELKPEFMEPDGWHWDWVENKKGESLRMGWTTPNLPKGKKPKGFVVIAPGLSEFCEKYFEVIRDLKKDGYAVAILEWRGQGLSHRHIEDRDRRHSDGFEHDVDDFKCFMDKLDQIRAKEGLAELRTALLAHSMGGNITLRYLHDHQDDSKFESATFSAPMFGINLGATEKAAIKPACATLQKLGKSHWYAPGQGKWSPAKYAITQLSLSTDKDRRKVQGLWFAWDETIRAGGVTYQWVYEAQKSCDIVQNPEFGKAVKTRCFIGIAEDDIIVSNKDILATAENLHDAEVKEYEKARHELMMEKDPIRSAFLSDFKSFAFK